MAKEVLGRREPTDWEHVAAYPLGVLPARARPYEAPVVLGLNWYSSFDRPKEDNGRWYIGLNPEKLGVLRGGMAVVAKPDRVPDLVVWWDWYDQQRDPAAVGFAVARLMSLTNRRRYDARWLWDEAKIADEWEETQPGDKNGTSLRAGLDVVRDQGARIWRKSEYDKLKRNRWMTSVDEIRGVLASPRHDKFGAVPLLASWGRSYPHVVWMPYETLARLLGEAGEATVACTR
jgi:hypothetical protein